MGMAMQAPCAIHRGSCAWRWSRVSRVTGCAVIAGLLLVVWQAGAESVGNGAPKMALGSVPLSDEVNDADLKAIYGKGNCEQTLRPEVDISVILWDESKRKVPIHAALDMVTSIHSDIRRQSVE